MITTNRLGFFPLWFFSFLFFFLNPFFRDRFYNDVHFFDIQSETWECASFPYLAVGPSPRLKERERKKERKKEWKKERKIPFYDFSYYASI